MILLKRSLEGCCETESECHSYGRICVWDTHMPVSMTALLETTSWKVSSMVHWRGVYSSLLSSHIFGDLW